MNWTLLNPWWLLFGIAALLPLILFLLRRRTPQQVEWGAMQFLVDATRMPSARRRWKQWLLLAIRIALPLLVAIVVATPGCRNEKLPTTALAPPTHWILIFDLSASMGPRADGSAWTVAKGQATKVVGLASSGDTFSIVSSGNGRQAPSCIRNADQDWILLFIDNLKPGGDRFDAYRMIEQARELINSTPSDSMWNFKVVVFSDFQEQDWPGFLPSLDVGRTAETRLIPCGPAGAHNISIQDLGAVPSTVTNGQTFECRATIVNDSPDAIATKISWDLNAAGENVGQLVSLEPGETKTVSLPVTAQEVGTIRIQASIDEPTGITLGKSQYLTVDVRPSMDVLCLEGRDGASRSFVAATTPIPNSRLPAIFSTVAKIESASSIDLYAFDVVAIFDVAEFRDRELKPLIDFVNAGGRLLLSMGDNLDVESWESLMRAGAAIPVGFVEFELNADPIVGDFRFDPLEYQHPVVSDFRDEPRAGLIDVPIQRYYQLKLLSSSQGDLEPVLKYDNGDLAPVLKYDNGDLAMLAINVRDRGRILVSTTPLFPVSDSDSWNEILSWWSYVPIVNNAVAWLFGDVSQNGRWQVGETRAVPVGPHVPFGQVVVTGKEGRRRVPVAVSDDGRSFVELTPRMPGFFRIEFINGRQKQVFAVNMQDAENDLRQADMRELEQYFSQASETANEITNDNSPRRSTRFYVAGLLVTGILLLLEPFLANRNRHYQSRSPA